MRSRLAKVWHPVGGLPLVEHALRTCEAATAGRPIVVVAALDETAHASLGPRADLVLQENLNGTGGALAAARSQLAGEREVLVLPADMPLLRPTTLQALLDALAASGAGAAVLTTTRADARGYGRIVRNAEGQLSQVVEDADAPWDGTPAEVNLGVYAFSLPGLWQALAGLNSENAQGELYLSWVPQAAPGGAVTVPVADPDEAIQVNDRVQLAEAERALQQRTLRRLMLAGVTISDPYSTWIDCDVEVGADTVIWPGTVIRGRSRIGSECLVGPFAELDDVETGSGCRIGRSHLSGCKLADGVDVGPFNRVRPQSEMGPNSHLGTFTEVVRSRIGEGSQIPHLSYVGDAEIGRDVNYGAGSITANWDGLAKHRTQIADRARLGSGTILVAPVAVGEGAYTGAGSVITGDVPAGSLALSRVRQRNVIGWVARRRGKRSDQAEGPG